MGESKFTTEQSPEKTMIRNLTRLSLLLVTLGILGVVTAVAQDRKPEDQRVRTVTIPISLFTRDEIRSGQISEFIEAGFLSVKENGQDATILSIRTVTNTPIHIAIVIQEDLVGTFNLQLKEISNFIRTLPADSRVMVAYMRSGSIEIRQRFTTDLDRAASSLRIVSGSESFAPRSPFGSVDEVLSRFDSLPTGRRAIMLFSDGVDPYDRFDTLFPSQSPDLERATLKAQRSGVAIYSFYNEATFTKTGSSRFVTAGQGSLNKLSEETGGKAFFSGSFAPVSYEPFFKELSGMLSRQFALTYMSTNMKKGYYRVEVTSTNPEVRVEHPRGYFYR